MPPTTESVTWELVLDRLNDPRSVLSRRDREYLRALIAERDALREELADTETEKIERGTEILRLLAERDALREALHEIVDVLHAVKTGPRAVDEAEMIALAALAKERPE
jgi:hypothetical protein